MSELLFDAIVGGVFTLLAAFGAAYIGIRHERSRYETNLARDLGRVEGQASGGIGPTVRPDSVAFQLGQLMSWVETVREDVAEIRADQVRNRELAQEEHRQLRAYVESQISQIKVDIGAVQVTLQRWISSNPMSRRPR